MDAVKHYSHRLTTHLIVVFFIGWLTLFTWSMSLWVLHGYPSALDKITVLINTQREAITPVYQDSLLEGLPWITKPSWTLSIPYLNQFALNDFAIDLGNKSQQCFQLFLLSSQCLLIKLMMLLAAIPLFILTMAAGLIDGLNQRAIRTACLGRESSFVFHKLNRYSKKLLVILILLWIVMPISITPALVFVPISLLMGFMVAITCSRFKKYL